MASLDSLRGHGLKVVWSGCAASESGRQDRPAADVVFVHGLNGGRVKTWTKDGVFWPRDLLPLKLPGCRVMTFGYNADLGFSSSTLNIRDFAVSLLSGLRDERQDHDAVDRPLIFVCHSLGGIVAKKALLVARVGDTYSDISRNTVGLVFFGTPHRGSSVADFGAAINSIAKFLDRRDLLSSLTRNNQTLMDISQDFVALVGIFNYSIKSFYEENRIAGVRLIVTKDSATMNITQEEALPLEGDHREMCRFASVEDPRFGVAWNTIKRLIPVRKVDALSSDDEKFLASIPGVDVEECLQRVKAPLSHSCDWITNHPLLVSLQTSKTLHVLHILGKPGSGKSTLAGHLYRSYFKSGLDRPVFFFSFAEKSRSTAASAWGCLLRQLIEFDPGKIREIRSRSRPHQSYTWSEYRLQNEFETIAKRAFSRTSLFIIDGIDECDSTVDKFLESVEAILEGSAEKAVKFLFLGRRQDSLAVLRVRPGISGSLSSMEIDKEPSQLRAVRLYVEQKVDELCARRPGLRTRKDYIVQLLCDKSEGMYLLPELAIASLRFTSGYDADVMAQLERIPPQIRTIYRKALDEVIPQHRPTVSNLFLWMTFGLRHLSEQEMSFALASTADPSVLRRYLHNHLEHAYFDILGDGGVQAVVGTLLKATETFDGALILELVHGTARQYLMDIQQRDEDTVSSVPQWLVDGIYGRSNVKDFREDPHPSSSADLHGFAHVAIYQQCFSCLEETLSPFVTTAEPTSLRNVQATAPHDEITDGDKEKLDLPDYDGIGYMVPFFSYASENIFEHARHVPRSNTSFYEIMATKLDDGVGKAIRQCFWHSKDPTEHAYQPLIHFACELGLEGLVACLVQDVPQDFRDHNWTTPLNTAAATGIVPILRLLCESGKFSPTAPEKSGGTSLNTAVYYGHLEATKYLLSKVPEQQRNSLREPAVVAAQIDNVHILKLFEEYQCLTEYTFYEAVTSGSIRAMDYLSQLPHIDPAFTNTAGTMSHAAARSGAVASLEWLRLHGLMSSRFHNGCQPIHLAADSGRSQALEFLVKNGHARVDDPDTKGMTALRLACMRGHYETVAVAIQHGASTRWQEGETPDGMVTALDVVIERFGQAYSAGESLRLAKTVWVLLDLVPDLRNEQSAFQNSPGAIAGYAQEGFLQYALKSRSEVFKDDPRGTNLATDGQKIAARSLLEHFLGGVNHLDEWERTPLHNLMLGWPSLDPPSRGQRRIAWMSGIDALLAGGADLLQEDILGMTPFDLYTYTLTGLEDTGALSSSSAPWQAPPFIHDGSLKKLCTAEPRLLEPLKTRREDLLLALARQKEPRCVTDTELLLTCFTEEELSGWIARHATAAVLFLLRAAGRPDGESTQFLAAMSPAELTDIFKDDLFPDFRPGTDMSLVEISPLGREALACLRRAHPAAVTPAIAAAFDQVRRKYEWRDNRVLVQLQKNCLPAEIPADMARRLFLSAAEEGNVNGVRYLVERCGVSVDEPKHHTGRTALLVAAAFCNPGVVEYLLSRRAALDAVDSSQRGALYLAATSGYSEITSRTRTVEILVGCGAEVTDELVEEVKKLRQWEGSGTKEVVEVLERLRRR